MNEFRENTLKVLTELQSEITALHYELSNEAPAKNCLDTMHAITLNANQLSYCLLEVAANE